MAEVITKEQLENASVDAKDLGECVHGNESGIVTPRIGDPYPTLPAAIAAVENKGGYIAAPTLAALNAIVPEFNHQVARVDESGDEYRWDPSATPLAKWVPTGKNWLNAAKAYADANPLFKPATLTAANNLNDVRAEGLYKPTVGVPSLALNYPVTGLGELHVRNLGGNVCVQTYWVYGTFGQWIRTSDGSGNWPATWDQIGTKSIIDTWITASKAPINLTGSNNTDLNTLTNNGLYAVYSTNPVNVSNFPKPSVQGFLLVYTLTNVTNQLFLMRGTNEMHLRSFWGANNWTLWEKLATSNDLTSAINTAIAAIPFAKYDNLIYTQSLDELLRNPLKSTRIKLIGDSITWGMGSSAVSPTEPRTGYLTDPRNSTVFTSKTWANLLRQWIAKVYGNGAIIEDRSGSAYTTKLLLAQWREIYTRVKMTTNQNVILTDAQKLAVLDTNVSFESGTSINLVGANFAPALRPQQMEFEITGDNLMILFQKQSAGDVNDNVKVYVDGVEVDSFSYYSETVDNNAEHSISFAYGKHTIKIVNASTNANSYVRISGFRASKKSWVINEGIIGLSTATLLSRNILESTLDGYDDVILFMLGTNDRQELGGVDGFKKRLNDSLDRISLLSPMSKVVLMSSTYANTDAPTAPYKFDMGVVDKIISTVARERSLIFISQYKGCAQALIDSETIWSDGLHLNDRGNQLYYQNIRKKLFEF
ncbi:SGNH/GDSL hydrolase family protein [Acinetobacter johnsonii]|uniref:SGNH/GDSL hydrolase family protein n=1 Tax=Acinetobacter johnsonii TaxID=40214 RepID=UPI001F26845A|nr:SGNH/GDSL hydrolase family protein [Acinetobacter johnsonii]UIZ97989.1 hypothetical protein GBN68_08565 [Acinetobacter johnsonii]